MKLTRTQLNKIVLEETQNYLQETGDMDVWEVSQTLLQALGAETLLQELIQAMNTQEAMENFEFIARMHDIDISDALPDDDDEMDENLGEMDEGKKKESSSKKAIAKLDKPAQEAGFVRIKTGKPEEKGVTLLAKWMIKTPANEKGYVELYVLKGSNKLEIAVSGTSIGSGAGTPAKHWLNPDKWEELKQELGSNEEFASDDDFDFDDGSY